MLHIFVDFLMWGFWNFGWIIFLAKHQDILSSIRYHLSADGIAVHKAEEQARLATANKTITDNLDSLVALPETIEYRREMVAIDYRRKIALMEAEAMDAEKVLVEKKKLLDDTPGFMVT